MYDLRHTSFVTAFRTAGFLSLALVLGTSGCKSNPVAPPLDDSALTQAVQGKLTADTSLGGEPIQASVQQGVATLSGTVSTDAARSLAASDAAQIAGIRTVVNNLVVDQGLAARPAPVAPASRPVESKRERPARHPKPAEHAALPATPPAPVAEVAPPSAPIQREAPSAPATPPPPPPPAARSVTLNSGTTLAIRITQTLDSATAQTGETFSGVLASDVLADGLVVLPQGTPVSGRVVTVQEAAHFKGNSLLTIELTSLDRKGGHLPITTDTFSKAGNGRGKNSAEKIGGGAAVGAILGGILGGGKGAAIGAAAGGGAGAGVQAATRGKQVQIESETLVRFHLTDPVTVRVSPGTQPQSPHDDADLQHHQ